jgi:hypothetical protein
MSLDAPNSRGSALGPAPVNLGANTSLPWTTGQVKKVNLAFLKIAGRGCRTRIRMALRNILWPT